MATGDSSEVDLGDDCPVPSVLFPCRMSTLMRIEKNLNFYNQVNSDLEQSVSDIRKLSQENSQLKLQLHHVHQELFAYKIDETARRELLKTSDVKDLQEFLNDVCGKLEEKNRRHSEEKRKYEDRINSLNAMLQKRAEAMLSSVKGYEELQKKLQDIAQEHESALKSYETMKAQLRLELESLKMNGVGQDESGLRRELAVERQKTAQIMAELDATKKAHNSLQVSMKYMDNQSVLVSHLNSRIQELVGQVNALQKERDNFKDQIASSTDRIAALEHEKTDLSEKNSALEKAVEFLKKRCDELSETPVENVNENNKCSSAACQALRKVYFENNAKIKQLEDALKIANEKLTSKPSVTPTVTSSSKAMNGEISTGATRIEQKSGSHAYSGFDTDEMPTQSVAVMDVSSHAYAGFQTGFAPVPTMNPAFPGYSPVPHMMLPMAPPGYFAVPPPAVPINGNIPAVVSPAYRSPLRAPSQPAPFPRHLTSPPSVGSNSDFPKSSCSPSVALVLPAVFNDQPPPLNLPASLLPLTPPPATPPKEVSMRKSPNQQEEHELNIRPSQLETSKSNPRKASSSISPPHNNSYKPYNKPSDYRSAASSHDSRRHYRERDHHSSSRKQHHESGSSASYRNTSRNNNNTNSTSVSSASRSSRFDQSSSATTSASSRRPTAEVKHYNERVSSHPSPQYHHRDPSESSKTGGNSSGASSGPGFRKLERKNNSSQGPDGGEKTQQKAFGYNAQNRN